ncbi:MAG: DUF1846 domain-containing protein [Clostridiales bacterium]|jgi:uncharacterized protein (UPF0371 family)|nr:DUF1846 domain-containing protein [Clostridiales bacterium]
MIRSGFDLDKYISLQSEMIKERIDQFGGKLYVEFGGKLFDDYHASRVLPGFLPDSKIRMLCRLQKDVEIVIAINSDDIGSGKLRGDIGISYPTEVLRLIDAFRALNLYVNSVVITQYRNQPVAEAFKKQLEDFGMKVYLHYPIEGYPYNVAKIVSEEGYGKNDFVETTRSLVVVTAPGPGSGKIAACLSQLYHENKRGVNAGYAKFETFPIWNLPLKHPVNLAYEAATADLDDVNMIDPYHLDKYGKTTVNYNRDVEIFPVLNATFEKIYGVGKSPYHSPTDMGVNMAGYCIENDALISRAALDEIVRRYLNALVERRKGRISDETVRKLELLMKQAHVSPDSRPVVEAALQKSYETENQPACAIELPDGRIVTGKTSALLGAASAAIINAIKDLAGIEDSYHLIGPEIIEPIQKMKTEYFKDRNPLLHCDEVLIALSICAVSDPKVRKALDALEGLKCCEAHSTVILSSVDEELFHKLGMNLTCEPVYGGNRLFHK